MDSFFLPIAVILMLLSTQQEAVGKVPKHFKHEIRDDSFEVSFWTARWEKNMSTTTRLDPIIMTTGRFSLNLLLVLVLNVRLSCVILGCKMLWYVTLSCVTPWCVTLSCVMLSFTLCDFLMSNVEVFDAFSYLVWRSDVWCWVVWCFFLRCVTLWSWVVWCFFS